MKAYVLIAGVLLFASAMVAHVLLWRIALVKKEILWLFATLLLCPLLLVTAAIACGYAEIMEGVAIVLVHTSLAVVYIQTYPALREDIPSIRILMLVDSHPGGMDRMDILSQLDGAQFLETKIDDLENDVLVASDGEVLRLTHTGTLLAVIFGLYRRLLGASSRQG